MLTPEQGSCAGLLASGLGGGGYGDGHFLPGIAQRDDGAKGAPDSLPIKRQGGGQGSAMGAQPPAECQGKGIQIQREQELTKAFVGGGLEFIFSLAFNSTLVN